MFPIFAGNSASTGYNLTRSLRFRASASAYLSRTNTATVTNNAVWTWSAWVKIGYWSPGNAAVLFGNGNGGTNECTIKFTNNQLEVINYASSTVQARRITTQVFRDPSAWYHIVVASNSSTALNIYVNGVQVTSFGTSTGPSAAAWALNTASAATNIGFATGLVYFDGYLTEVNFIDGQALTPSSFGSTNALTGVWQPARYTGTYGTNGFYLPFTDNSALTTSSNVGLGKDFSGNGNYWTTNNISITAGVTYDSMTDVPTLTSATAANFAVLNPVVYYPNSTTIADGNLKMTGNSAGSHSISTATIAMPNTGKWYAEFTLTAVGGSFPLVGLIDANTAPSSASYLGALATTYSYAQNGTKYTGAAPTSYGASYTNGDVIAIAFDATAGTLTFYKNNTSQGVAFSSLTSTYFMAVDAFNGGGWQANFGQQPFTYTAPSGFVALNTYNLPTSTIVKGNTVMDATLYTGTLLSNAVTNAAAFKPDLVWVKSRSAATDNKLTDSVRGVTKGLISNTTGAETTDTQGLTAFNTNGFTVGTNTDYNNLAATYVAWQWQAGQGSSGSNTNGSITSTVSVNASAGFSVVTYTGTGANATIGHGLGVAPSLIIIKQRSAGATYWATYHSSIGNTSVIYLNDTGAAFASSVYWNNTSPTSSVFTIGTSSYQNTNGSTYVAYCWTPIAGYSAFGSYTGNGSTDGPFVYTGFLPRWVLVKRTDASGTNWDLYDTARNTYNAMDLELFPNSSSAEYNGSRYFDFLSNGFKPRTSVTDSNASGGTYIYAAFATNPFKNSLAR
jgi:hypothetical protein